MLGPASIRPTVRMNCANSRALNLLWGCDVIKTCASGGGGTDKEEPDIRNMTQEELDAIVDEAHAFIRLLRSIALPSGTKNGDQRAPTPSSTWCFRTTSP